MSARITISKEIPILCLTQESLKHYESIVERAVLNPYPIFSAKNGESGNTRHVPCTDMYAYGDVNKHILICHN